MSEDNTHAGQGPVLLDIGGDVGAAIVSMPVDLTGREVEARPVAGPALATLDRHHHVDRDHGPAHHHLVHVGVVQRPSPAGPRASAVFAELVEGTYELYLRPDGAVALTVTVAGGEVSSAQWPL